VDEITVVKPLKDEETLPIRTVFTGGASDASEAIAIENVKVCVVVEWERAFFAEGRLDSYVRKKMYG